MEITRLVVGMVETNCYIAVNPDNKQAVIVDPGDDAPNIAALVTRLGVEVKAILLTHGHFDHVMAMEELKKKWGIPVYACEAEAEILADPAKNLSGDFRCGMLHLKADILLKDRENFELIGYQFQMIHTPGHTGGSCCYYVESEKVLFSGDTLFEGSYGRIDFPTGSGVEMMHSIVDTLFDLPDGTAVYPGHMGYTTIGDEKKYNPLAGYRGKGL